MASSSSSSPRTWVHDVFPSFSGEDVRVTFLSHFLKELDRKLITTFIDNNIVRGGSLAPELTQAIKDSRIAVVVLSKNYASSSWCLNELLEIMQCKEDYGQIVIPVFYDLDPSHVRKQTGDFGDIFGKTCEKNTKEKMIQWKEALTNVANILGFHSLKWDKEANMIEKIVDDVLNKLSLTTPKDTEDLVDIESHISKMSELLDLKSEEVRMVGIWGSSGIGKTTIARVLNKRISRHFKGSVFIDKYLISKIMAISCNPDDYNIKLHLQEALLSKILDKTGINVDHLDAVGEKLKHHKVLIFIDDVDDQLVLDALAGETNWFGLGSRIVVITKDKHFLRAQKIDCIYEVGLPTDEQALQMFCRSAFRTNTPPQEFMELASEVALRAGNLPLGLKVLGSHLRGRDIEDWVDMMPRLRNDLDGKIERTLRVSYDGLDNTKDQALFRYIACIFNGEKVSDMKQQLADITQVDVNIGFKLLVEKSLVHVRKNTIEMHLLLQEMGKEIVRTQSNKPGEREFLLDSKDICNVFKNDTGTENILGISLELEESDELHIHDNAFKRMCRLLFLKIEIKEKKKTRLPLELDGNEEQHEYESAFKRMFRFFLQKFQTKEKEKERLHLPYGFNYLPSTLISLIWEKYPLRYMPFKFAPENLVKLQMRYSQLEKLWDGTPSLSKLKYMDLRRSKKLMRIPNLSMATNLENLNLSHCSSLVELPCSIKYLTKLDILEMSDCVNLLTLPSGDYLRTLSVLNVSGCLLLKTFPDISTNIEQLILSETSIERFPSNLCLENLARLTMTTMKSDKLWEIKEPLTLLMNMVSPSLHALFLSDISSLVELPSSIKILHKLKHLQIKNCKNLESLPTNINFENMEVLDLSGCSRLSTFPDISTNIKRLYLNHTLIEEVPWWIEKFSNLMDLNMIGCKELHSISSNISKARHPKLDIYDCSKVDREALIEKLSGFCESMMFSGEQVPSYFNYRTIGSSPLSLHILLPSPSRPRPIFKFIVGVVINCESIDPLDTDTFIILIRGQLVDSFNNGFSLDSRPMYVSHLKLGSQLVILDCPFSLSRNVPLSTELDLSGILLSGTMNIQANKLNTNSIFEEYDVEEPPENEVQFKIKEWGIR